MAVFYNTSTVGYNDSGTPYNGPPQNFTYSGNITMVFLPNYSVQHNHNAVQFYYTGRITKEFLVGSHYVRGRIINTTTGLRMIMAPSSTVVIRHYLKVADPIRVAGCPQCGTYLYNER